ncbi:MAG: hypothetical protein HKN09_07470 [Saprospiraceae bacterium]|nr:hypothetical protein [Saprospiraceae bacterium]
MKEEQGFDVFITALAVFVAVAINFMLVYTTEDVNEWIILGVMIVNSIMALTFLFSKLVTEIDNQGIRVRFFPWLLKEKYFDWKDIEHAYVREYKPLREYGGWGVRYGRAKSGKAYNTKGKLGIQLHFKDGKKLLIGTQKPNDMDLFLNNLYIKNIVKNQDGVSE